MYIPIELDELRLIRALAAPRSGESIAVARLRYKLDLWIAQAEGKAGAPPLDSQAIKNTTARRST